MPWTGLLKQLGIEFLIENIFSQDFESIVLIPSYHILLMTRNIMPI